MRLSYSALPLPLLLLLSVQLLNTTHGVSANIDNNSDNNDLPTSQLLTRADGYLASGRGQDALELYDVVANRDKSSYVSGALLKLRRGTAPLRCIRALSIEA
jgi:hypothetical protein